MPNRPIAPPIKERMVDENGIVTRPWGEFFTAVYRYQQANNASVADATYVTGLGTPNGEITITNGFITTIQEVG